METTTFDIKLAKKSEGFDFEGESGADGTDGAGCPDEVLETTSEVRETRSDGREEMDLERSFI